MTAVTGNHALIEGWVTPRAETVLRRAVAIAVDRGYHYLGVEHLALAIAEEPLSLPARVWDKALTIDEWHGAIIENLPAVPADIQPLTIEVSRSEIADRKSDQI